MSQLLSVYQYKNGTLKEVSEHLRTDLGGRRMPDEILYLDHEIVFRYDGEDGSPMKWLSVKENGTVAEVIEKSEDLFEWNYVMSEKNGEAVVVLLFDQILYAYSDGVLKVIAENIDDMQIYKKMGKSY